MELSRSPILWVFAAFEFAFGAAQAYGYMSVRAKQSPL